MQMLRSKILLIGESENRCKYIIDIIKNPWNEVIFVSSIEMAIKVSMKEQIDLIICFNELVESNAFQVYRVLNDNILKNEVPFIIVLNEFCENNLLIGIELGIDSFIFPAFDSDTINHIVNLQLKKNKEHKEIEKIKYDTLCKVIPYGVFMAENTRIVEANAMFYTLIHKMQNLEAELQFNKIFSFCEGNFDEFKLSRLTNGLEKKCIFNNVKLVNYEEYFDVYFSFVKKIGAFYKVIGIIMPIKNTIENSNSDTQNTSNSTNTRSDNISEIMGLITAREMEILQLSAKGIPVKQIALMLNISHRTVEKHRSNIIHKTNSENIVEAVFMYSKFITNNVAES